MNIYVHDVLSESIFTEWISWKKRLSISAVMFFLRSKAWRTAPFSLRGDVTAWASGDTSRRGAGKSGFYPLRWTCTFTSAAGPILGPSVVSFHLVLPLVVLPPGWKSAVLSPLRAPFGARACKFLSCSSDAILLCGQQHRCAALCVLSFRLLVVVSFPLLQR